MSFGLYHKVQGENTVLDYDMDKDFKVKILAPIVAFELLEYSRWVSHGSFES